jgi:hypothetical protein
MTRVRQRVGADELVFRMRFLHVKNIIAPDKTGPAGYQYFHKLSFDDQKL